MLKIFSASTRILSFITPKTYFPQLSTLVPSSNEGPGTPELDKLFKKIIVECRGHDRAVLNSYEWFAKTSAQKLSINISRIWEPREVRTRRTLLKSVFIYKKHRVQYEMRTYFRFFELTHITGSSADTYLEYIQRNLPEGVSMKVTKHQIQKLPEHIENYVRPQTTEDAVLENKYS